MPKEIEAQSRVLEAGDAALIEGSTEAPQTQEGEELVSFEQLEKEQVSTSTLEQPEEKPAAKAPEQKPATKQPVAAPAADDEADIPPEYRGKSKQDIIKMHREAASKIGSQGAELGELRKRVDFAIQASLAGIKQRREEAAAPAKPAEQPVEIDEGAIFSNPKETISKMIAADPIIRDIRAKLGNQVAEAAAARAQQSAERFHRTHPDAGQIMQDREFQQWVDASPVRRQLLARANNQYDFHSGDEIFSTWKALKGASKPAAPAAAPAAPAADPVSEAARTLAAARAAKAKEQAAAAAAVPSGGASSGKQTTGKKIYRRADIVRLNEENPARYEELADEIMLAYAEGRVR